MNGGQITTTCDVQAAKAAPRPALSGASPARNGARGRAVFPVTCSWMCLGLSLLISGTAHGTIEGPPQATLLLNQARYLQGDRLVLTLSIQAGTMNNTVDFYFWIRDPGGRTYYLGADGQYNNVPMLAIPNVPFPTAFL